MRKLLAIVFCILMSVCLFGCSDSNEEAIKESIVTVKDEFNDYKSLRFKFEANNKEYEVFITGLKLGEDNSEEEYKKMIDDLATEYSKGLRFVISDSEEFVDTYGLDIKVIDAEKQNKQLPGQSQLCWAASCADMLEYTGWAKGVINPLTNEEFKNEDDIFDYYIDNFTDKTSQHLAGIKWFFSGVNMYHKNSTAAFEKNGIVKGLINDYISDEVTDLFNIETLNLTDAGNDIIYHLDNGDAVSMMVCAYQATDNEDLPLGKYDFTHAVTVFGYIKDVETSEIAGIFLADSDNDASRIDNKEEMIADENGYLSDGFSFDKNVRINKYTMFPLGEYIVDNYTNKEGDFISYSHKYKPQEDLDFLYSYEAYEVKHYFKDFQEDTIVYNYGYLANPSKANKETVGKKNALKYPDLFIDDYMVFDCVDGLGTHNVKVNEPFSIQAVLSNGSYVGISDKGSYLTYRIVARNKGKETILEENNYNLTNNPLGLAYELGIDYYAGEFMINEPGTYEISFEITGIFDSKDNPVEEAYTINNVSHPWILEVE